MSHHGQWVCVAKTLLNHYSSSKHIFNKISLHSKCLTNYLSTGKVQTSGAEIWVRPLHKSIMSIGLYLPRLFHICFHCITERRFYGELGLTKEILFVQVPDFFIAKMLLKCSLFQNSCWEHLFTGEKNELFTYHWFFFLWVPVI